MRWLFGLLPCILISCQAGVADNVHELTADVVVTDNPYVIVLGTVQDGGSPHIGCSRECCKDLFAHPDPARLVVSLGIVDPAEKKVYMIEATPDLPSQMEALQKETGFMTTPDGIFLTHAHIGHYTGLMYLGREALGSSGIPVYTMPGMKKFLNNNGPWDQLVSLGNITLKDLNTNTAVRLTKSISIEPFIVPHRDEYSETVGFRIEGPNASLLFIPDIDKWHKWDRDIREEIAGVDYALVDGSFFNGQEISYRDISEIPHPFMVESFDYFREMPASDKSKIHFIHFNHTNPVLANDPDALSKIREEGYSISMFHERFSL